MTFLAMPLGGIRLAGFNPVAKLAAAAIILLGLLTTADLVTVSIVLGAELVAVPLAGIHLRVLAARTWPLPVGAAGVAVANLVASDAGPGTIAAISLRVCAIALPGVLVFATTDPLDLADSLVGQLHLPARFAYGSLAALRLLPLLSFDWATIRRARRARGIDAGWSPSAAVRLFGSGVFAFLVAAIRRATRLAAAMNSRGFDSGRPRTMAREPHFDRTDAALVVLTATIVALANSIAIAAGSWHPLIS